MILIPLLCVLYMNFICEINAQNKQCINCKYFISHKNSKMTTLGLCKMFGKKIKDKSDEKLIYNFAEHCRDDENLCGKNAIFYDEIEKKSSNNVTKENIVHTMDDEIKIMINDYYNFLRHDNDW